MKRILTQLVSAILLNGAASGFVTRTLYDGPLKGTCAPVLNCWSCPSAVTGCPLGAIQAMIRTRSFPTLPLLYIILPAAAFGRFLCGWACPFGLLQDALFRVRSRKLDLPRPFTYLTIPAFVVGIVVLPLLLDTPWYSRYLCPAGTIEASIPWYLLSADIREQAGMLFWSRIVLTAALLAGCIVIFRLFCRTLCPLGLLLGLFNPVAAMRLRVDLKNCDSCGRCSRACPVGLDLPAEANNHRCIRCMNCATICPSIGIAPQGGRARGEG